MAKQPRGRSSRSDQTYQTPLSDRRPSVQTSEEEFALPPGGHGGLAGFSGDPTAFAAVGVDADLQSLKLDLEQRIFSRPPPFAAAFAEGAAGDRADIRPPENADLIVGVGIGPAHRDFESVGPAGPGVPVLNVYVAEKMDADKCKSIVCDGLGAHALASDRRPINVIHTGPVDAYAHRHRERPSPCGISVSHSRVTAGTLGALARGRSGDRRDRLLMLSNNHVLAKSNAASAGDHILQPANNDFGENPDDRVAILEQWVPINFAEGNVNYVDCATAWCWPEMVRKEFIYRNGSNWDYFRVGSTPIPAVMNMPVGKSGRKTQLTSGRVVDLNASIRVNYGVGIANFSDLITIRGNNTAFGEPGDSGALIWTWDDRRLPVGLLFAGGNEFIFANKIARVLDALDIELVT